MNMSFELTPKKRGRKRKKFVIFNNTSKQANLKANEFIRKIKKGIITSFVTGNNKKTNTIVKIDDKKVYVLTEKSDKPQEISIESLKYACFELLKEKTMLREEMEKHSRYNSSLFGIVLSIFVGLVKKQKLRFGRLRLTIKGCRFFFSGLDKCNQDNTDWRNFVDNGGEFALGNYIYLKDDPNWYKKLLADGIDKILLDSGEFKNINAMLQGKPREEICVYSYCDFINEYKPYIYKPINLDVYENPYKTKENQKIIEELTGIRPIPVWHVAKNFEENNWKGLEELVKEEHTIIGIGGTRALCREETKKRVFQEIFKLFPEQNFHWLGGSSFLCLEFDWFSSDCSGWLNGRKKPRQLYTMEGFNKSTKTLSEDLITKNEGLTFNVSILSNLEYMNWNEQSELIPKAPKKELDYLWEKIYRSEKYKVGKDKKLFDQLVLF